MQFGYGNSDFDPTQTTESIGNDWVAASEYGMKNLHRVIPSLLTWMYEEGESYEEVKMRYMQMFVHWGRMTERRSEEHTSELQSRGHLVCRLLLEKKKNRTPPRHTE